jgi:TPR repeat protein
LALAGCCACLWLANAPGFGQGRKPPALVVSAQIWVSPGSEQAIDLKIVPGDAIPSSAMVVVRDVPQGIRFSEGRPFGPGVWVIPVARLPNLKMQTPADSPGGGALTLVLTSLEGTSIAEAHTLVIVMPPTKNPQGPAATAGITVPAQEQRAPPAPKPAEIPKAAAPPNKADLVMLLEKGRESARIGNVQHARQFYLRAAERGLAEAALALAMTYDPAELARMKGVKDVPPDPDLARKWYQRARELGSSEAAARLTEPGQ